METNERENRYNTLLCWDDPKNISLECEDCNEVILDAELYTICEREDI